MDTVIGYVIMHELTADCNLKRKTQVDQGPSELTW